MAVQSGSKKQGIFSIFDAAFMAVIAVAVAVLMCSCSAAETQSASSSSSASSSASASAPTSSQSTTVSTQAEGEQNAITITVTSPEGPNAIDFAQEILVPAGATVLDALQATELEVSVVEGSYGAYVEAIGGIASEGTSGWIYTVNGEQVQVSAGEATVNDGDTIEWSYIDMAA